MSRQQHSHAHCNKKNHLTDELLRLVEPRTGKLPLMGRYHKLPRKLSNDYCLTSKVLGTGYNGSVRLACSAHCQNSSDRTKDTFAVKSFHTKTMNAEKLSHLQAEIEIFLCMDHPQVARLVDVYEGTNSIDLVMECMDGGELFDRVLKCKRFTESSAAEATKQILLAVSYLHTHGIVHRDLKLENFLYDTQGSSHLKLIDFGFSKFYDTKSRMHTGCGTLAYVAPEVLSRSYTSQCDLWSTGVIVFILLSGHMPFFGKARAQMQDIADGNYTMKPEHWTGVSNTAKSFVRALLEVNPDRRLSARTALQHGWITSNCQEPQLDLQPMVSALHHWLAAPQLLRACMCMMAWTLSNEQHAMVRDHFLALDTNHDGAVSLDELKAVMVDQYGLPEEEVANIFKIFVAAHDREIHYSDLLAAMTCERIELDDDLLQTTFSKFDTTGAGCITARDFHEVLGAGLEDGRAEAFVREADGKGIGRIDFEDFAKYTRSGQQRVRQAAAAGGQIIVSCGAPAKTQASKNPTLLGAPRQADQDAKVARKRSTTAELEKEAMCCTLM